MIQELVYTSAPRGLQLGKSGFCTVASTAGMAENVARLLESLSGYRHLFPPGTPEAAANPVNYSHLISKVGGRDLHIVSRIADAGLDYSGRSNKIAHHVAFDKSELPAGGLPNLFRAFKFETRWDRDPARLDPRKLPEAASAAAVCRTWQQVTGDAGWGGGLAEAGSKKRTAFVIIAPGMPALDLALEALALLPPEVQEQVTFSTFYTNLPANVQCLWRFVLSDSPEAAAAKRNPQNLVIDCTSKLLPCSSPAADEARGGVIYRRPAIVVPLAPSAPASTEQLLELNQDDVYELPPPVRALGDDKSSPPPTPYRLEKETPPSVESHVQSAAPELRSSGKFRESQRRQRSESTRYEGPDQLNIWGAVMLVTGLLLTLFAGMLFFGSGKPGLAKQDTPVPAKPRVEKNEKESEEVKAAESSIDKNEPSAAAGKGNDEPSNSPELAGEVAADNGKSSAEPDSSKSSDDANQSSVVTGESSENVSDGSTLTEKTSDTSGEKADENMAPEIPKPPIMLTFALDEVEQDGLPVLLASSPTELEKNKPYLIAKLNRSFKDLLAEIGQGIPYTIKLKEPQSQPSESVFTVSQNGEITANINKKGAAITYVLTYGFRQSDDSENECLLTVSFSEKERDELDLQGDVEMAIPNLSREIAFPVASIPVRAKGPTEIITTKRDLMGETVGACFLPEIFEELNKSNFANTTGEFNFKREFEGELKLKFKYDKKDSPELTFAIACENGKANLEFKGKYNIPWEKVPYGNRGNELQVTDRESVEGFFLALAKKFEKIKQQVAEKESEPKPPNQGNLRAVIEYVNNYLKSFEFVGEKKTPNEIHEFFQKLSYPILCKQEKGQTLVILSSSSSKLEREGLPQLRLLFYRNTLK